MATTVSTKTPYGEIATAVLPSPADLLTRAVELAIMTDSSPQIAKAVTLKRRRLDEPPSSNFHPIQPFACLLSKAPATSRDPTPKATSEPPTPPKEPSRSAPPPVQQQLPVPPTAIALPPFLPTDDLAVRDLKVRLHAVVQEYQHLLSKYHVDILQLAEALRDAISRKTVMEEQYKRESRLFYSHIEAQSRKIQELDQALRHAVAAAPSSHPKPINK